MDVVRIQSEGNQYIKRWKKLHSRKGRYEQGAFIIEGEHLIHEAKLSGLVIEAVLIRENEGKQDNPLLETKTYELPIPLFDAMMKTSSPQGIAAVVKMPVFSLRSTLSLKNSTFLLLDAIQDPGNLGTLIRSSDASGVSGIFLEKGTVDPYNDKVIRAAMGSLFRVPIMYVDLRDFMVTLKEKGVTIIGASPRAKAFVFDFQFPKRTALLLGNEGNGVDETLMRLVDQEVKVPMPGATESLNVAVTGSILMYEQLRQQLCL